jgi:hypothetical protein
MEGTGLSKLLDGVLIDSVSDFDTFNELKRDVDKQLSLADPAQRDYLVGYIQEGIEMEIIDPEDGQAYQSFLEALNKNPRAEPPVLRHLDSRKGMKGEMKHPSVLKAAELFHTLNKLHLKRQANLFSSMTKLVSHRWDWHLSDLHIKHDLEIKRLQCSRLVNQLRRAMAVNLDSTVTNWRINSQPPVLAALSPPAPEPPRSSRETMQPRDHFYEEYYDEEVDIEETEYNRRRLMHKRSLNEYEKRDRLYGYVIKLIGLCSVRFEQLAYWRWRLVFEKEKLRRDKLKEALGLAELIAISHSKKAIYNRWRENIKTIPIKETRFTAVYTLIQRLTTSMRSTVHTWQVKASSDTLRTELNRIRSKSLGVLRRVPARTQREAIDTMSGGNKHLVRALRVLMRAFQHTPQSALTLWNRRAKPEAVKTVESHSYRPELLDYYLSRVPRFNLRGALVRFFEKGGVKTTLALQKLSDLSTRKPRQAITSWKSYMLAIQERKFLDANRSHRLSTIMNRLVSHNLHSSFDHIVGEGSRLVGALRRLNKKAENQQRTSIGEWRSFVSESKSQDKVRGKVLLGLLNKVPHRLMKEVVDRKLATSHKLKSSLVTMENVARRVPVQSMNSWSRNSSKKTSALESRATSLQTLLRRLPNSSTRQALDRVLGEGSKMKGILRRLSIYAEKRPKVLLENWHQAAKNLTLKRRMGEMQGKELKVYKALESLTNVAWSNKKSAVDAWSRFVNAVNKQSIFDNARSLEFKTLLERVVKPKLRKSLDTLLGGGNRLTGVLYRLDRFTSRKPAEALRKFRDNVTHLKEQEAAIQIKSERLRMHLENVPRRSLRDAYERVTGDSKSFKKSISILDKYAKKAPVQAVHTWQRLATLDSENEAGRARNFVKVLSAVPSRTLRSATDRLYGEGSKTKGAMRRLAAITEKDPELYLMKWREHTNRQKMVAFFEKHRSNESKFFVTLSSFVKEASRKPKQAVDTWRRNTAAKKDLEHFIQTRKLKLEARLENLVKPNLRRSLDTLLGGGNRLTGVFYRLDSLTSRKLGQALKKWTEFVSDEVKDAIEKQIRTERLRNHLNKLARKNLRSAVTNVTDKAKEAQRVFTIMDKQAKKVPVQAINTFRRMTTLKGAEEAKQYAAADAKRTQQARQFVELLSKVPVRTLRGSVDRILGEGDRAKGALRTFMARTEKKPERYFQKWRGVVREAKIIEYLEKNRSTEAKMTLAVSDLINEFNKRPRSAVAQWKRTVDSSKGGSNKGDKLNFLMSKIARPTLRGSFNRVIGDGSTLLGALRNLNSKLKRRPVEAIARWRTETGNVKGNALNDNLQGIKLVSVLNRVPVRSLRNAFDRTAAEPKQVKSTLSALEKIARKQPTKAVNRLDKHVAEKIGQDATLGQRLAAILERVPRRKLKDVAENFLDEHTDVKRSLRALEISVTQRKRQALERLGDHAAVSLRKEWDDNLSKKGQNTAVSLSKLIEVIKKKGRSTLTRWSVEGKNQAHKELIDSSKAKSLQTILSKVARKTLRSSQDRIIGVRSPFSASMLTLMRFIERRPALALKEWRDWVNSEKQNPMIDNEKALRLKVRLERLARKPLNTATDRLLGENKQTKAAVSAMNSVYRKVPRQALSNWRVNGSQTDKQDSQLKVKNLKLQPLLEKLIFRTLQGATTRIYGDGSIVKGKIMAFYRLAQKRPKDAVSTWRKFVTVENAEISRRGEQLKYLLNMVPIRRMKEARDRFKVHSDRVKLTLSLLHKTCKDRPRAALQKWFRFMQTDRTQDLKRILRAEKLRNALDIVPLRTEKSAYQLVNSRTDPVKLKLMHLIRRAEQRPRSAINKWRSRVSQNVATDSSSVLRATRLKTALAKIPMKTLRSGVEHITGSGSRLRGALFLLLRKTQQLPKDSLRHWLKVAQEDSIIGSKIRPLLERITLKNVKNAVERLKAEGDKTRTALFKLLRTVERRPKNTLDTWKRRATDWTTRIRLAGEKLKLLLNRVPSRTLVDSENRLLNQSKQAQQSLSILNKIAEKKPRNALNSWNRTSLKTRTNDLYPVLRAQKLNQLLSRLPRRNLHDASTRLHGDGNKLKGTLTLLEKTAQRKTKSPFDLLRNHAINCKNLNSLDAVRAQKLKNLLSRVPRRTLRDAEVRLMGDGSKVNGALINLHKRLHRMPKNAFDNWSAYVSSVKKGDLLDEVRAQKLKNTLSRVPLRTLRDSEIRLMGSGSKVNGALLTLSKRVNRMPKDAFDKWNKYLQSNQDEFNQDKIRGLKLKGVLDRIPSKTLRSGVEHITGSGSRLRGALFLLLRKTQQLPKDSLRHWLKVAQEDSIIGSKIRPLLERITLKNVKNAVERLKAEGDKTRTALFKLLRTVERRPKNTLDTWKRRATDWTTRIRLAGEKLKLLLNRVPSRTLVDSENRLLNQSKQAQQSLSILNKIAEKKPRNALNSWNRTSLKTRTNDLYPVLRAQKLNQLLSRLPRRNLHDASTRLHGDGNKLKGTLTLLEKTAQRKTKSPFDLLRNHAINCKNLNSLDAVRAQKLKNLLSRVPRRTLRDAEVRLMGDGSKVNGALINLHKRLHRMPKNAFDNWSAYVSSVKKGDLLDEVRAQKLKNTLSRVPLRTLRDSEIRLMGSGSKVNGALLTLSKRVNRMPKDAFDKWNKYLQSNQDEFNQDKIRGLKLKGVLDRIPSKTLRSGVEHITGSGSRLRGALFLLLRKTQQLPKDSLRHWLKVAQEDSIIGSKIRPLLERITLKNVKNAVERLKAEGDKTRTALFKLLRTVERRPKNTLDTWKRRATDWTTRIRLAGEKLKLLLNRVPSRTLVDSENRLLNQSKQAQQSLSILNKIAEKKPRNALNSWNRTSLKTRTNDLYPVLRAQKLNQLLSRLPRRNLHDASTRLHGDGNKLKGTLTLLEKTAQRKTKSPFDLLRNHAINCKNLNSLDAVRAQKLKNLLSRVPRRTLRDAEVRLMGDGSKVNGALINLHKRLHRMPKNAFDNWSAYVSSVKKGDLLDEVRAQKLKNTLSRVPLRTLRDSEIRLMGSGSKVNGALLTLHKRLNKMPKDAFDTWWNFVVNCRNKGLLDEIRAQKLRNALSRIPRRTLNDSMERIIGGDKVRGALQKMIHRVEKMPKEAYDRWWNFVLNCRNKGLHDEIRAQKLKNALSRIPRRALNDSIERIIGGDKVRGALQKMIHRVEKMPKEAYDRWWNFVLNCRNKSLLDAIRAQKLKNVLSECQGKLSTTQWNASLEETKCVALCRR